MLLSKVAEYLELNLSKMQKLTIYKKLNEIIKISEDKIKLFQKTRNDVDSYKRVLSTIFNKKVYHNCVAELEIAYDELSNINNIVKEFSLKNKDAFIGIMSEYLKAYTEYLNSAVNAAEKRLILQKLIRDIKVNNIMKHYQGEIPNMIGDVDKLYEDCRLKAVALNSIAEKIKNAKQSKLSRREKA